MDRYRLLLTQAGEDDGEMVSVEVDDLDGAMEFVKMAVKYGLDVAVQNPY